ncbi:hypothetical protein MKW94_029543 [Papaver nudicaule]|uniref:Dipeptidylpeptidase IV N-terminal domain-containing protein n=1 Tax=Papaver nudicaule TaxID=74823 RepID=A0AA41VFR0_PAPNU|nr:hypothetical protein [Papaver nudicaule]
MGENKRGSIAFFATYRPPVPLDIFACPLSLTEPSDNDELSLIDDKQDQYNYNGREIPKDALKKLLKHTKLSSKSEAKEVDIDNGLISGIVFVSERNRLELLHIALRFKSPPKVEVYCLSEIFGETEFNKVCLEDSGCFTDNHLIYVSTKEPAMERRQPWTAVYQTDLKTGETKRLTPPDTADLSPSVSPSKKMIAVASYQGKEGGWQGEIEDLKTNIYLMDVEAPHTRRMVVENGGWPTWGSDNVIFFHRKDEPRIHQPGVRFSKDVFWGVYRVDISQGVVTRVTPADIDGFTPTAIDANRVAVVTVREESPGLGTARDINQFRQIEIFDSVNGHNTKITQYTKSSKADHFNPFLIDGGKLIGYHRGRSDKLSFDQAVERPFQTLDSILPDVGLFRVSGVFPTISKDGKRLAFVDNEFKAVWVADSDGLHIAYEEDGPDRLFSPVWNQSEDTLYVCVGPSFNMRMSVNINAITNVSRYRRQSHALTDRYNNAFPSSSPDGKKLVYRSTGEDGFKNLYIMEDSRRGVVRGAKPTRLTKGEWTDTHCQWSPKGDWIVFSSTRDKPEGAPPTDQGLDPGYFAVFLVKWDSPDVLVRVMTSGRDISGHVNHPCFSPNGRSIVVSSDIAGVSVDPISLPLFEHSVRSYGDIFSIDLPEDYQKTYQDGKYKNGEHVRDVEKFTRITHSKYEYSTATWNRFATGDPNATWKNMHLPEWDFTPACPYLHQDGGESYHMTGHLVIPRRCC